MSGARGGRPPRTLRARFALATGGLVAVAVALALGAVAVAAEGVLVGTLADRLELGAGLLTDVRRRPGPPVIELAASDVVDALGGQGTAVAILGPDGAPLAVADNGAPEPVVGARLEPTEYESAVRTGTPLRRIVATPTERVLVVAVPVRLTGRLVTPGGPPDTGPGRGRGLGRGAIRLDDPSGGPPNAIVQLATSLAPVDRTLGELRLGLLGIGVLVVALAAGLAAVVARSALRPLDRVVAAADRLARGDLSARAGPTGGPREIERLGRAFDGMAERVEATFAAERQFAADAAHELKTPLTILGGYVDLLRAGSAEAEAPRILDAMRREIDRLGRLASDLLFLARVEAAPVELGELLEHVGEAIRAIATGQMVVVEAPRGLVAVGDRDRLSQAVLNLADNAVRHTPPGGTVRLIGRRAGERVTVEVWNTGTPIPADELPRLFDRFFRGRSGAGGRDGHAGLGLAIAKAIVERSGGTIDVASDASGTRFRVVLPAA